MNINNFGKSGTDSVSGRILVVDSDENVCDMIRVHFQPEGFGVDWCSGSSELYNIDVSDYRLLVVDLGIEDDSGLNIIEQVKQSYGPEEGRNIAVIACSQRMSPATIINALNAGADDYLLKPFSLRELMARVHAVLRRC